MMGIKNNVVLIMACCCMVQAGAERDDSQTSQDVESSSEDPRIILHRRIANIAEQPEKVMAEGLSKELDKISDLMETAIIREYIRQIKKKPSKQFTASLKRAAELQELDERSRQSALLMFYQLSSDKAYIMEKVSGKDDILRAAGLWALDIAEDKDLDNIIEEVSDSLPSHTTYTGNIIRGIKSKKRFAATLEDIPTMEGRIDKILSSMDVFMPPSPAGMLPVVDERSPKAVYAYNELKIIYEKNPKLCTRMIREYGSSKSHRERMSAALIYYLGITPKEEEKEILRGMDVKF